MLKRVTEKDLTKRNYAPVWLFLSGFLVFLAFGWIVFPQLLYSSKRQPIEFNHAVHARITDYGCESCHYLRNDGSFSGIPQLETCATCHRKVVKGGENEKILILKHIEPQIEIPWLIYSRQPDHVFFSHAAHIIKAELPCETCHGQIGQSMRPKVYQENRLTGYSRDIWGRNILKPAFLGKNTWDAMRMDDCVACHQKKERLSKSVQTDEEGCFVCHK